MSAWLMHMPALQESAVQSLLSSQFIGSPVWQPLAASQTSDPLQASPSSQAALSGAKLQAAPFSASQVSVVQSILSSHLGSDYRQLPSSHWSFTVQGSPSSHGLLLGL